MKPFKLTEEQVHAIIKHYANPFGGEQQYIIDPERKKVILKYKHFIENTIQTKEV